MGLFERYLSVWVAAAILVGVLLGLQFPSAFAAIAALEYAHVNLVVAVLIWAMIFPMMVQVDFSAMKRIRQRPQGIWLTLAVNWLIKPFSMALLGWLFFRVLFVDWVDPQSASEYIAGMILLGVAPCTAMVFVWSQLTKGDPNYTLAQVAMNDVIMIFAFAPIAAFLLGISSITVPWQTLLLSVLLYVLLPFVAGISVRKWLRYRCRDDDGSETQISEKSEAKIAAFSHAAKPASIAGLLLMVALLFGFQAPMIIAKPLIIFLIAIPLLLQSYGIFALAYVGARALHLPHNVAAPAGLIGTSNFFELAVAVAISLFGLHSGAALATVVGVLVEVPVMLSLVALANRTRHWFDHSA